MTPFVCYDLRFPEPFRLAADDTDLFAVVANWPEARREHWRTLLRARAIENLCYVAGVNRVGRGRRPALRRRLGRDLAVGRASSSKAERRRPSSSPTSIPRPSATPGRSSRRSRTAGPEAYRR